MKKLLFVFGALFLAVGFKAYASVVINQGSSGSSVHIEDNTQGSGSTYTKIETNVNGNDQVYESNKPGNISVQHTQNSYTVQDSSNPTPQVSTIPAPSESPTPTPTATPVPKLTHSIISQIYTDIWSALKHFFGIK